MNASKVGVSHAIAQADVALGLAGLSEGNILRTELRAAGAAAAALVEVAKRAIPLLQDDADRYEDDGGNEPLECLRDLEAAIASVGGDA